MSINPVELLEAGDLDPLLLRALEGLRFGSVEIVVHDGRIVQIERRERVRFETDHRPPGHRRPIHKDQADRTTGGPASARAEERQS